MSFFPIKSALAVLLPLALATGCGGGGSTSVLPDVDAANEQPTDSTNTADNTTDQSTPAVAATVSGRVADGYIQGATVCVDINENGACDDDEPSATTGEGGTYELDIPEGHTDKPIIADVPATAIDEDTGLAIGKKLTLSTPPGRPEFISPITTLVHEELKENPNLSVDEAEGTVKEDLGLSGDDDTGLFVDYVANQNSDNGSADEYRFLHQAARVIATMMDGIQDQVEQAASDGGVDFTADEDTRKAMRQLVRNEVKQLLPDIALAVAQAIQEQTSDDSSNSPDEPLLIDVEQVAEGLELEESELDFVEKIDAIKEKAEPTAVAVKDLLTEGMYWLEVECEHEYIVDGEDFENEPVSAVQIILDDEGAPSPIDMPSNCYAEYGHVTVDGVDNELVETTYEYDAADGAWVETMDYDDESVFAFHLVDGEWVAATDDGPSGPVEFLDDGGAILQSGFGNMLVYATSVALDNTRVIHHIYRLGGNEEFSRLIGDDALFPEGSTVHHLGVKRKALTHMLFNWEPHDDSTDCEQFNGNCNVVDVMDDAGFAPATSLDAIREQSLYGVKLNGALHNHYEGYPIDLELKAFADAAAADGLPESGIAHWFKASHHYPDGGTEYHNPDESYYPHEPFECIPDDEYEEKVAADGSVELPTNDAGDVLIKCSEFEPPPYDPAEPIECIPDYEYDEMVSADGTGEFPTNDAGEMLIKCSEFEPLPHHPHEPFECIPDEEYDAKVAADGTGELPTNDAGEVLIKCSEVEPLPYHECPDAYDPEIDGSVDAGDGEVQDSTGVETFVPEYCVRDNDEMFTDANSVDGQFLNDVPTDGTALEETETTDAGSDRDSFGTSHWKLITIEGVTMIEVELPLWVREGTDAEDFAAFLLIEENGYVRRGARLRDLDHDNAVMYSEAAFKTLQSVAEDYVSE